MAEELERLRSCGSILAVKVFRLPVDQAAINAPVLPCLDHEAMLHHRVAPHISAYVLDSGHADIHEVGVYPSRRRLHIDTVSTLAEHSDASHTRLVSRLHEVFPGYRVVVKRPSWWRGERRVVEACRAQITLREVLTGEPSEGMKRQIDRLQVVGGLMEKQSRVASWGVRTVTGPLLAGTGVVLYAVLGMVAPRIGMPNPAALQYAIIGTLGAVFLYYGLKAVQLTDMANRVWKRASEYSLILSERVRLEQRQRPGGSGRPDNVSARYGAPPVRTTS